MKCRDCRYCRITYDNSFDSQQLPAYKCVEFLVYLTDEDITDEHECEAFKKEGGA